MPRVPIIRETQVSDQALPSARVNTNAPIEAFGGGEALNNTFEAARGLNNDVASGIVSYQLKKKKEADDIRIQAADLETSKVLTDIKSKVKSMEGQNALGAQDFAFSEWKKQTSKIRDNLSSENQRLNYDKIRSVNEADLYNFVESHSSSELKKYDTELTDAYILDAKNTASANFLDTGEGGKIEESLFKQQETLKKYAERHGIPQEVISQKIANVASETYAAVINSMISSGADQVAKDYYNSKKEYITKDLRVDIEKSIEEASILGDSQREADKLLLESKGDQNVAFTKAKNIKNPELRKSVEDRLEREFVRLRQVDRDIQERNFEVASQLTEQNRDVPGNLWWKLNATQRSSIMARRKQINSGVQPSTDWTTFYHLKTVAANDPNKFLRENLLEYRSLLSDNEFKGLVELQTRVKRGDSTVQTELGGFRNTNDIVKDTLLSAGIDIKARNKDTQKKIADFRRKIDENIQIVQEQTGKKVRPEDVQKIADNLLVNAVIKGGGWFGTDTKKRMFEIQYADIPQKERSKIISVLKEKKKIPTERKVLELYLKGLELSNGQ